jgi:hypothetical protein
MHAQHTRSRSSKRWPRPLRLRPGVCTAGGCVVILAAAGCASGAHTHASSSHSPATVVNAPTYPLPAVQLPLSAPTDMFNSALIRGYFHATLLPNGVACAWLGGAQARPTTWPAGWRVRFHPTQLINPAGKTIASEGQWVTAGGGIGVNPAAVHSPCIPAGTQAIGIAYQIAAGQPPS